MENSVIAPATPIRYANSMDNNASDKPSAEVTPSQPERTNETRIPSAKVSSRKKLLLAGLGTILIAALFLCVYLLKKDGSAPTAGRSGKANQSTVKDAKSGPVFCVSVGLRALQCEELDTGTVKKFELPKALGDITEMTASPDGSKYFVSSWQGPKSNLREDMSVYDSKLKRIATLPAVATGSSYRVEWLDGNTLVYLTTGFSLDDKSVIKSYEVGSAKETVLVELNADIERIMPSNDRQYLYAIRARTDSMRNVVTRSLVAIDLQKKTIVDIENGALGTSQDAIAYDRITNTFYLNVLRQAEQKFNTEMYKVHDLKAKPRFSKMGQINDVYVQGHIAYAVISTKKGVFATEDTLQWKTPLKLYAVNGETTELKLAVAQSGSSILLSLPAFPAFAQAKTSQLVTDDLFQPTNDIPKKIVAYVSRLAQERPGCREGEYASFIVQSYDQDKQFSLTKAGCGSSIGTYYYRAAGEGYEQFAASGSHGFDCEQRDKLGISATVLPSCRQPGEGI